MSESALLTTTTRWRQVRPWLPPVSTSAPVASSSVSNNHRAARTSRRIGEENELEGPDPNQLRLKVLDVTATAVAVSVIVPHAQPRSTALQRTNSHSNSTNWTKPPLISIQLDRRPWPHVAHASSTSTDLIAVGGDAGKQGGETTIVVYNLDPGRDYEISLDVVSPEQDIEPALASPVRPEVEVERIPVEEEVVTVPERSLSPSPVTHPVSPEGPPPPYSANLPPAPPNESQLRALLKKIRTSSKRTETVLNSSILALKKSVEKGMKEDQRSRTRMVGLEEAIRKASEGAEAMRTREMELCKASLDDLVRLESESREELEKRKEGIKIVRSVVLPVEEPVHEEAPDEEEAGPEDGDGLVELARELDALNKAIEIIDREKKKVAKENLRALEVDLGHIEGELIQLELEESHYYPHGRLSVDSDYQQYHQPTPPPPSSSGTGFKWRGGRFFRRGNETTQLPADFVPAFTSTQPQNVNGNANGNANGMNGDDASTFAREHQRLWAQTSTATPSGLSLGVRRRAGSLNSTGAATSRSRWGVRSTAAPPA